MLAERGDHFAAIGLRHLGVASSIKTFIALLDARILASSFDSHAVAVTPSGETVTTKYGIPAFGG